MYLMCVRKKIKQTGKKIVEATHSIHMVEGESVYRCVSLAHAHARSLACSPTRCEFNSEYGCVGV